MEAKKEGTIFENTVESGNSFSLQGFDKKGTLGTEITLFVDDSENVAIHTSCSQSVLIGMDFGDFTVTSGSSRNGGSLCEEQSGDDDGDSDDDDDHGDDND
ncbi:MAG: hypothetical protein HQ509_10555 [Candidatus Marinimicrobia bacterium]|nr:hypothetical protein [Candidatus Neomarinimicrobiota bacterium]